MDVDREQMNRILPLITKYRDRCLWYLRKDYVPTNHDEVIMILNAIEKHGDMKAFFEVRELKEWLSQISNPES